MTLGSLLGLGWVPVFSQVPLVVWITCDHTIHPPIEGLLTQTGVEPTLFQNSAYKVAGLQVHPTTPGSPSTAHVIFLDSFLNIPLTISFDETSFSHQPIVIWHYNLGISMSVDNIT